MSNALNHLCPFAPLNKSMSLSMHFVVWGIAFSAVASIVYSLECNQTGYAKILQLVKSPTLGKCSREAAFHFLEMTALPDQNKYKQICLSQDCHSLMAKVLTFGHDVDCDIHAGFRYNPSVFAANFQQTCQQLGIKPTPICTIGAYEKLVTLTTQSYFKDCTESTGISILQLNANNLLDRDYDTLCSKMSCRTVLNEVLSYNKSVDCKASISDTLTINPYKLAQKFMPECRQRSITTGPPTPGPSTNKCSNVALLKMLPLSYTAKFETCTKDTNINFLELKTIPTRQELKNMCASNACKNVAADFLKLGKIADCNLTYYKLTFNPLKLITAFLTQCEVFEEKSTPTATPSNKVLTLPNSSSSRVKDLNVYLLLILSVILKL